MKPVITTFDRDLQARNLITPQDWRKLAGAMGKRCCDSAARAYAATNGGAYVLLATDALKVYTRKADGRISTHTYKRGRWQWLPGQRTWTPLG